MTLGTVTKDAMIRTPNSKDTTHCRLDVKPVAQSVVQSRKNLWGVLAAMDLRETYRVLVVDAESAALEAISALFARLESDDLHFDVACATSESEASSLMKHIDLALISLDLLIDYACASEDAIDTIVLAYGVDTLGPCSTIAPRPYST